MSQHRITIRAQIPVVRVDASGNRVRLTIGAGLIYTPPVIDGGTF
jgi:hypothetical protein